MELSADFVLSPVPVDALASRLGTPAAEAILATLPEAIRRARLGSYLNDEQAQAETGLSKRQLRYLREKRRIEYRTVGKTILYPVASLFALIDEGTVPARAPLPA